MRIEPMLDAEAIRQIVTNKAIWPHVCDDSVKAEDYQPTIGGGVLWLQVLDDQSLGLYMVHPHNCVTYEIHTCLLPIAWGTQAKQAAKLVLDWIFQNTPCQKVITHVPENNALALRYAKRAGMAIEGNNRKSFLKNGQLLDQIQLGIMKEEHICQ
jgi:RimJ/RimL family protein N-acetyltransferase